MRPVIQKDACIGCGICPALCPKVFKMNTHGDKAEVVESDFAVYAQKIEEARVSCPTNAILAQN